MAPSPLTLPLMAPHGALRRPVLGEPVRAGPRSLWEAAMPHVPIPDVTGPFWPCPHRGATPPSCSPLTDRESMWALRSWGRTPNPKCRRVQPPLCRIRVPNRLCPQARSCSTRRLRRLAARPALWRMPSRRGPAPLATQRRSPPPRNSAQIPSRWWTTPATISPVMTTNSKQRRPCSPRWEPRTLNRAPSRSRGGHLGSIWTPRPSL